VGRGKGKGGVLRSAKDRPDWLEERKTTLFGYAWKGEKPLKEEGRRKETNFLKKKTHAEKGEGLTA